MNYFPLIFNHKLIESQFINFNRRLVILLTQQTAQKELKN